MSIMGAVGSLLYEAWLAGYTAGIGAKEMPTSDTLRTEFRDWLIREGAFEAERV